jgi:hypothetical protein
VIAVLNRYATPVTAGLFFVSVVSGIALFFHWGEETFHEMHEWLSMLFLAPFVFHLSRNWTALASYARRYALWIALALAVAVALIFAVQGGEDHDEDNPGFRTVSVLTEARLSALAPVFHTTPDALVTALKRQGYKVSSANQTIHEIATASGAEPERVLMTLMPAKRI